MRCTGSKIFYCFTYKSFSVVKYSICEDDDLWWQVKKLLFFFCSLNVYSNSVEAEYFYCIKTLSGFKSNGGEQRTALETLILNCIGFVIFNNLFVERNCLTEFQLSKNGEKL